MRKITFLLLLLFVAVGAGAKIITTAPVAGTPYKIKCIATDHTGYLGDDGTTLQGRHAQTLASVLEATDTEGQNEDEPVPYEKPQFGGRVWTWNTANRNFDAEGKESTGTPPRENSRGPVYKFDNVGNVSITPVPILPMRVVFG